MPEVFTNGAVARLTSPITDVATTIGIDTYVNFPNPSGSDFFIATLVSAVDQNIEIVQCDARTDGSLTVVRGQQSTTPAAFSTGDTIYHSLTAAAITTLVAASSGTAYTTHIDTTPTGTRWGALTGLVNSSNTSFTVSEGSYAPNTLEVCYQGIWLHESDFAETNAATGVFDFGSAPTTNAFIIAKYRKQV